MAPTRELSVETMERIIKLLQEGNPSRSVAKEVGCSQSAVSKIWCKYKQNGKVTKGKHTSRPRKTSKRQDRKLKAICLENRNCTMKQMKNKWAETGVNVCNRTVRNRLNEMGFKYRKAKRKRKQGYSGLKRSSHGVWMIGWKWYSVMNHESALDKEMMLELLSGAVLMKCIKMTAWRKQPNFPTHLWYGVACQVKDQGKWQSLPQQSMHKCTLIYIDIPSIEKKFGDDAIFQDDNASCHRAKSVKAFLQERHINSMTWPANSPDLNPIEN